MPGGRPPRASLAVPASVVLAGLIVAAAIYLRPAPNAADVPTPASSRVGPPAQAVIPPKQASSELLARDFEIRVSQQARAAMERQRPSYMKLCWTPMAGEGGQNQAVYAVTLSIDEHGHEVRRKVSPMPGAPSRTDVLDCLRALEGMSISILAPGKAMQVTIEYNFP
jgi:hypothetical protein